MWFPEVARSFVEHRGVDLYVFVVRMVITGDTVYSSVIQNTFLTLVPHTSLTFVEKEKKKASPGGSEEDM